MMMELVEVTKVYHTGRTAVEAVRGVSLGIAAGELVCIMGPSGSGKSTLMHLLGALDTPTTGKALFQGRDLQSLSMASAPCCGARASASSFNSSICCRP
jgi:putative ABC transport system ATP-binding protein